MADMTPDRAAGNWPPKWTAKDAAALAAGIAVAAAVGIAAAYAASPGFREAVSGWLAMAVVGSFAD